MHRAVLGGIAIVAIAIGMGLAANRAAAQPRAPTAEELDRASVLFERSALAYAEGRFDAAATLLDEAYALSGEPVLLYNLARAHEGAGHRDEALEAYRHYLASSPEGTNASTARERILAIQAAVASEETERERERADAEARDAAAREAAAREAAAEAEAARAAQREERERRRSEPWPWVVAGGGGAVLIASAVLGGVALERRDRADDAATQTEARALFDEGQSLAIAANVGLVVGGVLLGGGLTWGFVVLGENGDESEASVHLDVGPSSVAIRGTF